MSNTPRTDGIEFQPICGMIPPYPTVPSEFCRQLERELTAADERIHLLIAERDTARQQADQNYKLRDEFRELLGTDDVQKGLAVVREMKERIKRLEEAGDGLCCGPIHTSWNDRLEKWNKAKESKP